MLSKVRRVRSDTPHSKDHVFLFKGRIAPLPDESNQYLQSSEFRDTRPLMWSVLTFAKTGSRQDQAPPPHHVSGMLAQFKISYFCPLSYAKNPMMLIIMEDDYYINLLGNKVTEDITSNPHDSNLEVNCKEAEKGISP